MEVSIRAGDGATLAASLSVPGRVPAPVVIAIHGASGGTREDRVLSRLHAVLPGAGFGVLTFDRRGEGTSTGRPSLGDFQTQADDVADAVAWCRELPTSTTVGAFGFSQGAWVAPLVSRRSDLSFLVLVAACGVTPAEQMRLGVAAHMRRAGYGEAAVEEALQARLLVEAHAHCEASDESVAAALDAAAREPWWELAYLPDRPFDEQERAAWRREMDFDPETSIAEVDVPTLLLYGTHDLWVPVDESLAVWRRHHPALDVVLVEGAAHDLYRDDQPAPEAEQAILEWLVNRVGTTNGE